MNALKLILKFLIYSVVDFFISPTPNIKKNTLLLIRLDAIGDYLLFRNYIEIIRNSTQYKDYQITLLGNNVWKDISLELDDKQIDSFIWLDRKRFTKNPFYRYSKLKEITSMGYEEILSPIFSREFYFTDNIVKLVNAKTKIASSGDLSNISRRQKNISDRYYTRLIPASVGIMFEFKRNKEFFEAFFAKNLELSKPEIHLGNKKLSFNLPNYYAVLFIGASSPVRKWGIDKFAAIANHLKEIYNYDIVLCGGPTDIAEAKEFARYFQSDYLDLVGKTTLIDFLYVIYNGNIMVSNETSAPHLAVSLEMTNIFVIYNGNHYGRFTPYPADITRCYHVIYHPAIEKNLDDYKKLSNTYGFGSKLDINEISIENVCNKITEILTV